MFHHLVFSAGPRVNIRSQVFRRPFTVFLTVVALTVSGREARAQQAFVGQIRMFAGNFAPAGWMFCEGQVLPIAEYETLFNLIGTTYGGDGISTFALPDLRGRVIVGPGQGSGLSNYTLGQQGGSETVTLTTNQIPQHAHTALADSLPGSSDSPANLLPARYPDAVPVYGANTSGQMNVGGVLPSGGGQPHNNVKPYLAIRYIISLFGIYPTPN